MTARVHSTPQISSTATRGEQEDKVTGCDADTLIKGCVLDAKGYGVDLTRRRGGLRCGPTGYTMHHGPKGCRRQVLPAAQRGALCPVGHPYRGPLLLTIDARRSGEDAKGSGEEVRTLKATCGPEALVARRIPVVDPHQIGEARPLLSVPRPRLSHLPG
eukprot:1195696-Prorocentrum_minimum.AAC.2